MLIAAQMHHFVYLVAVIDWYARRTLAWPMTLDFCTDALEEVPARHGTLEVFNSGQGSLFTSVH